jgi:hypothetical protein
VYIPLCYNNDGASQFSFSGHIEAAANLWHDALGDNRGVEFDTCDIPLCGPDVAEDAVQLIHQKGSAGAATIGWSPPYLNGGGQARGRHKLWWDPLVIPFEPAYTGGDYSYQHVVWLAHELGTNTLLMCRDTC